MAQAVQSVEKVQYQAVSASGDLSFCCSSQKVAIQE